MLIQLSGSITVHIFLILHFLRPWVPPSTGSWMRTINGAVLSILMEKITLPKKNPSLTALICCVFIDLAPSLAEMRHAVIPLLVFRLSISSSPSHILGCSSHRSCQGRPPPWGLLFGLRGRAINQPYQPLLLSCWCWKTSGSLVAFRGLQRSDESYGRCKEKMEKGCVYCDRFSRHE